MVRISFRCRMKLIFVTFKRFNELHHYSWISTVYFWIQIGTSISKSRWVFHKKHITVAEKTCNMTVHNLPRRWLHALWGCNRVAQVSQPPSPDVTSVQWARFTLPIQDYRGGVFFLFGTALNIQNQTFSIISILKSHLLLSTFCILSKIAVLTPKISILCFVSY